MRPEDPEIVELIPATAIAARIEELARQIEAEFADTSRLVVIGLLRGSFIFIADLVRALRLPVEVDFLEVSSYGNATTSSREVRILKDLGSPIAGEDVLVVEDIVDSGHTLSKVLPLLEARAPRRLRTIALEADWTGFEVPDVFVVGYGIDYAQKNRALPYIGEVRFPA